VVEVALIRPGPIQGGSVHPFIRRKNGKEEATVPHPLMKGALDKTLGVPLFQEQLMQLAIDVAGFDAKEADQLRRAMGSSGRWRRWNRCGTGSTRAWRKKGITGELADDLFGKLSAFASYGFRRATR
jgi:error-prone DNA polymerase